MGMSNASKTEDTLAFAKETTDNSVSRQLVVLQTNALKSEHQTYRSMIIEAVESAPILKFGFMFLTPTVAWICGTISSNQINDSSSMLTWLMPLTRLTFGQESSPTATLSISVPYNSI